MLRVKSLRVQFATMTAICALAGAAVAQDMPASAIAPPGIPQTAAAPSASAPAAATQPAASQPSTDGQQAAAQPATPPPTPGPATPAANPLSKGQLDQLVAPIALYPDPLLSQVLMASTYPLEIVEADRWARDPAHAKLKGDDLTNALKEQNWDPSVMALVPFPKLLALMAEKLQWTQQLGNAFLAQQADVMAAVQTLRHDAMQAGNLKATPQCHCVIQTSGETISILPSDSQVVCVPLYNPRVVYGAWREPEYPPDYFPIPVGFYFEPGYSIGFWPFVEVADFGPLWGWWSLDWGHHDIVVDRGRLGAIDPHPSFAGNTWVHDPAHRGGVGYNDRAVTARFGAARVAAVTAASRTAGGRGGAAGGGGGTGAERFGERGAVAGREAGAAGARVAGARTGAAEHVGGARFAGARAGGAEHVGGAHFAGARIEGTARVGGGGHIAGGRMGGAAHLGGGARFGGGGHAMAHASFGAAHMGGGAPHGGGGAPHGGGGGGGPHGGGGGGGPHGGGGGGGGHHK